jgi:exodeoxyribonuclease V alpha subunit
VTAATYAVGATGLLGAFNRSDVLTAADVHVATTLGRLANERDEAVLLAVALAVRAVREGSVCIDLGDAARLAGVDADTEGRPLAWPDPDDWYGALRASPLVAVGREGDPNLPVRLVDRLLYLDRYWRQEELIRRELDARGTEALREIDPDRLRLALDALFPGPGPDHQRLAAAACALGAVTLVAGGPGTGKTWTVARIVALLNEVWPTRPRVALAAPTGKAAARLQESVAAESIAMTQEGLPSPGELTGSTLHRLLGWRPGSRTRFKHDRTNRLPFDVVVIDETSMVSLTMMARLLDAVRPDAALVLVGDPDQLASVEAGAVLGDLVDRQPRDGLDARHASLAALLPDDIVPADEVETEMRSDVVRLRRSHRFGEDSVIARLAESVRLGRADDAIDMLRTGGPALELITGADLERSEPSGLEGVRTDVVTAGGAVHTAALSGDVLGALAGLEQHRLLCAHRRGPFGVSRWGHEIERWLELEVDGYGDGGEWYLGRPLIVTANDYELKLYNGDAGVVVDIPHVGLRAAFGRGGEPVIEPTHRLSDVETLHAMTVHRAQGSQFERVTVILPPPESPLLTRELFYTAVSRAKSFVRVVGSAASVQAAVDRPIVRASGLRIRR